MADKLLSWNFLATNHRFNQSAANQDVSAEHLSNDAHPTPIVDIPEEHVPHTAP